MVGMKKSEEIEEAIRKETRLRRRPALTEYTKDEQLLPVRLTYDLQQDYETFMCEIAWKILFLKRKLDRIKLKSLPNGVPSLNEKRLKKQLAAAESLLNVIKDRLKYVEAIEKWEWELVHTYDQRAGISNVYDLYLQKCGAYELG